MSKSSPRILVLALSGIGNLLMQLPAIEAIKKALPDCRLTVWVAPRGTKTLLAHHPDIDSIIVHPITRSLLRQFFFVLKLLRQRYDISIMLSPGQRWNGALITFLAGIRHRYAHAYPHLGNPASSFLLSQTIAEKPAVHDIEQNLSLLSLIRPDLNLKATTYRLAIPPFHQRRGAEYISRLKLASSRQLIGFHPGSAGDFLWKRWPIDYFAELASLIQHQVPAYFLIFGGLAETKLKKSLRRQLGQSRSTLVSAHLLTTAAIISHCRLFIANDSGLMHLAAATGTATLGLFGPTDEIQTGPRGPKSYALRAPETKPVYHTEYAPHLPPETHETLTALKPAQVLDYLNQHRLLDPA